MIKYIFELPFIFWNLVFIIIQVYLYKTERLRKWIPILVTICYLLITIFWIRDNIITYEKNNH